MGIPARRHHSRELQVSRMENSTAGTRQLADRLGLPVSELVEVLGAGWFAFSNPSGEAWFMAGDPPRSMVRVTAEDVRVAMPRGRWAGPGELTYEPVDEQRFSWSNLDLRQIAVAVRVAEQRRRRSFRYCRYCRDPIAPEHRFEPNICQGCASTWLGVVY